MILIFFKDFVYSLYALGVFLFAINQMDVYIVVDRGEIRVMPASFGFERNGLLVQESMVEWRRDVDNCVASRESVLLVCPFVHALQTPV